MKKIVIIQFSSNYDGSAFSSHILMKGLVGEGWFPLILFSKDGPIISKFGNDGLKTKIVFHNNWLKRKTPLRFFKDIISEIKNGIQLYKVLKGLEADLLYVNTAASLSGIIAGKLAKKPIIWHIRELPYTLKGEMKFPKFLFPFIKLIIFYLPDIIIVPTNFVSKSWLGSKSNHPKIHIIGNAVDDQFLNTPRKKRKFDPEKIIIGIPGTLRPVKGHFFLLETIRDYFPDNHNIIWKISGEGEKEYKSRLEEFLKTSNLRSKVEFTGELKKMIPFYDSCDIIVVPSKSEAFGRTIIESFARKVPVIATDVGGIPELIKNGKNGLLVKYYDKKGLADAIKFTIHQLKNNIPHIYPQLDFNKSPYTRKYYVNQISKVCDELISKENQL